MPSNSKLLLTTSLLVSMGFGSATALAQTAAGTPATAPSPAGRPAAAPAAVLSPQQSPGQPTAAPAAAMSSQLTQNQKSVQDTTLKMQELAKNAAAEAAQAAEAERVKRVLLAKKDLTPQERATLQAILDAERRKSAVAASPNAQAAIVKEAQIRDALGKTTAAAQVLHSNAAAAEQKAVKLKNDLDALRKPNPGLGVNFTPQNVTPMLRGMDDLTKRLALIKGPEDMAGRKMDELGTEMAQLRDYMVKVKGAMEGAQLAGVETPANKEAMALYMRMPEFGKNLVAEMTRVQRLVPQTKAVFDKFSQ